MKKKIVNNINWREKAIREVCSKLPSRERKLLENRTYFKETVVQLILVGQKSKKYIGFIELFIFKGTQYNNSGFINLAILPEYRGKGGLEILLKGLQKELLNIKYLSFNSSNIDSSIKELYWGSYAKNIRSCSLAVKLGFEFEKEYYKQRLYKMEISKFLNKQIKTK